MLPAISADAGHRKPKFRPRELPQKYYLDHFLEFRSFLLEQCAPLLEEKEHELLEQMMTWPEDARCLWVRIINRCGAYVRLDSLNYAEIGEMDSALRFLRQRGIVRDVQTCDWPAWLSALTKEELQALWPPGDSAAPAKSRPKAVWLEASARFLGFNSQESRKLATRYLVNDWEENLAYWLFLYFGDLKGRLNQFSMRDLGVMRTRKSTLKLARFESLAEAQSAFYHACCYQKVRQLTPAQLAESLVQSREAFGIIAQQSRDAYLLVAGNRLKAEYPELAMQAWQQSGHPQAQERWLRSRYQQGHKAEVEAKLKAILDDPPDESLLLFAQDFYRLKFGASRTSLLTEMLRDSQRCLTLDEAHLGRAEQGIRDWYRRQGKVVHKAENRPWLSLFGLLLWQELFETPGLAPANEFERLPAALLDGSFYLRLQHAIEAKLALLDEPEKAMAKLANTASRYHGEPNGLFRWHASLLEKHGLLIKHSPKGALAAQLRRMAQHFGHYSSGYPDLMLLENDILCFEEIKAPGDSLRRNQLMRLQELKQEGWPVSITQIEWGIDPEQPYVVVDLETTGGGHASHRVTEIGLVKVVGGEIVDSWQSLVNPQRHIPSAITRLTGIDDEMVKDAPVFAALADELISRLQGCVFVAHNVNFDYGFLQSEFSRLDHHLRLPKLCTVREMRKAFPCLDSYSLGNLCRRFDIPLERHHRALDDANAAAQLLILTQQQRMQ
ncbi:exonuclease domain-containing protein [Aliiglaciecola sp. CAU 1673]|uniref:exonuclease domain-containing protein n=1 Tax=Aliiglaciecola sp. CAU 1673 TaxID=3032595 RepID=UPI0023DC64E0|nr:exonuclease domain-containing protein [Aliiglaciecola sp. CAU 1673]MDF2177007.1 exonuclease domain-containing protein [Aliiglaciecola sp. CAU 1673]